MRRSADARPEVDGSIGRISLGAAGAPSTALGGAVVSFDRVSRDENPSGREREMDEFAQIPGPSQVARLTCARGRADARAPDVERETTDTAPGWLSASQLGGPWAGRAAAGSRSWMNRNDMDPRPRSFVLGHSS